MSEVKEEIPLGKREHYPNVGKYIADCLKEQEVEVVFGVPGGHLWQIWDEISNAGIKMVLMRHEQAGVYAAEAYSKAAGKPGVAIATVGPGVANTVSAVQQAYLSCSPVIVIYSGVEFQHDRTYTIQPSYIEDLFRHITKGAYRCTAPEVVRPFVTRAFKEAQVYPKGPVVLEFSLSALLTPITDRPLHPLLGITRYMGDALYAPKWRKEETSKPFSSGGDPVLVEKTVKMLYEAKCPQIFAGDGVHWAGAQDELRELSELAKVPVCGRRAGRGAVPENSRLALDSRTSRGALKPTDLFILIGMKVGIFDFYYGREFGRKKVIQINESGEHIWQYFATELAVVGNPKVVLRQMIDYIKANNLKPPEGRDEWIQNCQKIREEGDKSVRAKAETYKDHTPVHFGYLAEEIWDTIEELYDGKTRIMIDGFTISDYMPAFIKARYSGQVMDSSEPAGVGHGIGMAIGAAFGDPETRHRPVLALMGDAGMGISGFDIETALRYRLPIVYLVTENRGWMGSIKWSHYGKDWQALGAQDREYGEECLIDIRYDKMFELIGCHGEYIEKPGEIGPALKRAFKAAEGGKTAIVQVKMDATVSNRQNYSLTYQLCLMHIPWDKLSKRGKALRRNQCRWYAWDELGIPEMPMPDPWEPVSDEEAQP